MFRYSVLRRLSPQNILLSIEALVHVIQGVNYPFWSTSWKLVTLVLLYLFLSAMTEFVTSVCHAMMCPCIDLGLHDSVLFLIDLPYLFNLMWLSVDVVLVLGTLHIKPLFLWQRCHGYALPRIWSVEIGLICVLWGFVCVYMSYRIGGVLYFIKQTA